MTQYTRTDRLAGVSTVYSYFGGSNYNDAPICVGECAVEKFYLEFSGEAPFYQDSNGAWSQEEFNNPKARKFDSFLDLLDGLSIELFMESGERVEEAIQTRTLLSQSTLDKFPVKPVEVQSFEDFNAARHGSE